MRLDRFNAEFNEPITKAHFEHTDTIGSPRASLVYKPSECQPLTPRTHLLRPVCRKFVAECEDRFFDLKKTNCRRV